MSVWEAGYGEQPEDEREAAWSEAGPDDWRGTEHPEEWPQALAGPEYWMYWTLDRAGGEMP